MQYKPEPINPPKGFDPNEAYHKALDLQGEPGIDGGNVGEVVITPTKDQFTGLERIPKELSEQIWNELKYSRYDKEYKTSMPDFSSSIYKISDIRPYLKEAANEGLDKNQTGDGEQDGDLYSKVHNYIDYSTNFDYSPIDRFSRLLTAGKKYPYRAHTDLPVGSFEENKRAYYTPSLLRMTKYHNISGIRDFLAELAHPYQIDYGTIPVSYRQRGQQKRDERTYPKSDPRHSRVYNTPGYYEHETHRVIEPMLNEYVFDNVPLNFKKLKQNEETK